MPALTSERPTAARRYSLVSCQRSTGGSWQSLNGTAGTFLPGDAVTRQQRHSAAGWSCGSGSFSSITAAVPRSPGRSITESTVYSRPRQTNLAGRSSITCTCTGSGRTALTSPRPRARATHPSVRVTCMAVAYLSSSHRYLGYPRGRQAAHLAFETIFGSMRKQGLLQERPFGNDPLRASIGVWPWYSRCRSVPLHREISQ